MMSYLQYYMYAQFIQNVIKLTMKIKRAFLCQFYNMQDAMVNETVENDEQMS